MVASILLISALTAHHSAVPRVRSSSPRIVAALERGLETSPTIRKLVASLEGSDVIVYLQPKQHWQSLGGYLSHRIVTVPGARYLRIYVDVQGTELHLISIIGHELQHAVEVAQAPEARDSDSLRHLFASLAIAFGCAAQNCYETAAATELRRAAGNERRVPRKEP